MKKFLIFIIIASVLSGMLIMMNGCNKEQPETGIRVMSFNIRTIAVENDPLNRWINRKEFVIDVIKHYDADLIGFQEVKPSQYTYLQEQLTEYNYYGVERSGLGYDEYAAVFYKKARFELLEEGTFWLSETPDVVSKGWDANIHRVCSWVKLKDLNADKEIYLYNTHFDHQGELARANSVTLLLERIGDKKNVIVTGDFNLSENSDLYNNLVATVLNDSKYLAPETARDTGGTFNGFGTRNDTLPIDFILLTGNDFIVNNYVIIRDNREGYYPSDHYPLYSDINYNEG